MNNVDLTDKELIIVWSVVAWFQVSRLATGKLLQKLYPDNGNNIYRYDKEIENRIISLGKRLEQKRSEATGDES